MTVTVDVDAGGQYILDELVSKCQWRGNRMNNLKLVAFAFALRNAQLNGALKYIHTEGGFC
jgi:hypothetical protein